MDIKTPTRVDERQVTDTWERRDHFFRWGRKVRTSTRILREGWRARDPRTEDNTVGTSVVPLLYRLEVIQRKVCIR